MSSLLNQVTPLTKGILWLCPALSASDPQYEEIDYLVDGLLTASLEGNKGDVCQLIIGENFGRPFYVMIVKEPKEVELLSFLQLIKKDLGPENNIVVIDQKASLDNVRLYLKELIPFFKLV
jgi:hypothetical protein